MNHNFDNPNYLTDAELVRLVQCRDEAAFTELISRYSPRIWNIVLDKSRQTRDAEEILMDIWLAVWNNIIGLRKVESFGAWLRKIANSACNRYYASKINKNSEIIMSYQDLVVYSAINIGILDTLNSPPFIPPQARGRDFWVYSVCSIYNKCLASQPFSHTD